MKQRSIRALLGLIISLTTFSMYGQISIYAGFKGGICIPNLSAGSNNQNPLSNGYSSRTGGDFGVMATFQFNKWLAFQPEIMYSQEGGKHNGLQAIPDPYGPVPPYFYANFKNTAKLNYLLVPLTARFDFRLQKKLNLYFNAGGFAGFLLSAKTVIKGNSYIYADEQGQQPVTPSAQSFDSTDNITSSVHKVNVGVIGAVGFSYQFDFGKIFIEGGGNYGVINIQKFKEDGKNYSGAATIHLGYLHAIRYKKYKKKTME
jgi:hypothetical protein